ncbi:MULTISPECIES: ABC transporter ATP-binding protein [Olivibacter]|uniref:ABC transporter ATP-binding protein n=1 Tax=Olivibacter jilunii TaxID=985016 RepID=A0ABW6B9Q1_9SPHI|nr:ABC transporter ATP-binding protein [Olivibacter sp. UJ_SKK_5.1]MDX3916709.1 ABC transporter ATP-binding protein [Pseudosphingobacterium sp.]
MANNTNTPSCDFIPSDTQKQGLAYIQVDNLSKRFSDKPDSLGLTQISFGVEQGKITAIIGESGSGKSTLLRLIYGLASPDEGEIRFKGWKVPGPFDKLIPGHEDMRLVSQHFDDLNTYANVWDNVASRLSNTNLLEKHDKTEIALNSLNILRLSKQRIADLSGGEKQRVAIARALVTGPQVLLMDEPFNQVDASFRDHLQQDIRKIVDEIGLTVIMVSHDPSEVLALSDALLILQDGNLMGVGSPKEIYNNPPNAYTARLLARSNILSEEEASYLLPEISAKEIIIHPEWIRIDEIVRTTTPFTIQNILFKGFYEEIILSDEKLQLRCINKMPNRYQLGQQVSIEVLQHKAIN